MTTQPQLCAIGILTNRAGRQQAVSNLGHSNFEIASAVRGPVEDFELRILDFTLPIPPILPCLPRIHESIMQNKPNFLKAKTTVTLCAEKIYNNIAFRPMCKNKPNQTQFCRGAAPSEAGFSPAETKYDIRYPTYEAKTSAFQYVTVRTDTQRNEIPDLEDILAMRAARNTGRDGRATGHLRHSALRTIRGGICWGLIGLLARSVQLLLLGYQPIVKRSGSIGIIRFLRHANIIAPTFGRKKQKRFHPPLSDRMEGDLNSKSIRAPVRRQETGDRGRKGKKASKLEILNPKI